MTAAADNVPRAERVSLAEKFAAFGEHWSPKIVAQVDDFDVKIVRIEGDFVWHAHETADEMFLVLDGAFRMDFRDRAVDLKAGELIVVPAGVEHKPFAERECRVMVLERRGIVNTGTAEAGELTNTAQVI